jgi:hypothetical protein
MVHSSASAVRQRQEPSGFSWACENGGYFVRTFHRKCQAFWNHGCDSKRKILDVE